MREPKLAGKVSIRFVIAATGAVMKADVTESTLDSESARACMVDAVRTWRFPKPAGGGVVTVNYPFIFTDSTP